MKQSKNNILTEELTSNTAFFNKTESRQINIAKASVNPTLNIQEKCASCEQEEELQKKELSIQRMGETDIPTQMAVPGTPATTPYITEDHESPEPGQMRKSEFLARLNAEVCKSVNEALVGSSFNSDNCPYLQSVFSSQQNRSASELEALIARYAPETKAAQTAEQVIQLIKIKAYSKALEWLKNGATEGLATQMVNHFKGGLSALVSSTGNGISSAIDSVTSGIGSMASGIGNILFKENSGGAQVTHSAQEVMNSLGKGQSLDSSSRNKMEGAFGNSLSDVEIHTDLNSAQLSNDMNARAFTVGNHIAFAAGEYQPGSMVGDALLAHELAHTVQQKGGQSCGSQMKGSDYNELEQDADEVAVNVVSKLNGGKDKNIRSKVKKGLTISRCKACNSQTEEKQKSLTQELIDPPSLADSGRIINVRGEINHNKLVQDLAKIDVLGTTTGKSVDKKIDNKKTNVYEVNTSMTAYTETWVKEKFTAIFPTGSEHTITKKTDIRFQALQELIAEYRSKHPNSFSKLQGHNMLGSSCEGACIGTFNRGVQNLYGINTIDTAGMDDTAFGTIDKLNKKKFISKMNAIGATYSKDIRIPEKGEEITLGTSIGKEMQRIISGLEDGVYPFLLSIANGYHSITIIFYKQNGIIEILWRDQHWVESDDNKKPQTADGIDSTIKNYLAMRAKAWARIEYNKANDPDIDIYSNIPEGEKKEAAKKAAEPSARKDISINRYGKLDPVDTK